MNANINLNINLDFIADDRIKLKIEYVIPDEGSLPIDSDSEKQYIVPIESIEDDDELNIHFYETEWVSLAHIKLVTKPIVNVKKIRTVYVYIIYENIIYKYIFQKELDSVNIVGGLGLNISIKDGPISTIFHKKPSVLVNNYGPIEWEYMQKCNIWRCWYCGLQKAIDIEGTKEGKCIII